MHSQLMFLTSERSQSKLSKVIISRDEFDNTLGVSPAGHFLHAKERFTRNDPTLSSKGIIKTLGFARRPRQSLVHLLNLPFTKQRCVVSPSFWVSREEHQPGSFAIETMNGS